MRTRAESSAGGAAVIQTEGGGSIPTSALPAVSARECVVSPCAFSEIRAFLETHHYSHSVNGVKVAYCFRVDAPGGLVGALLFGAMSTTAWRRFGAREAEVVELRRMVLLDRVGPNAESRVVSWTLRWLSTHAPGVRIVVSYADPAHGHSGVLYRAANFQYRGLSGKDVGFRDRETGRVYHSRALRTRGADGEFKPFVRRLRDKLARGELDRISLPGKHTFTYTLTRKEPRADAVH